MKPKAKPTDPIRSDQTMPLKPSKTPHLLSSSTAASFQNPRNNHKNPSGPKSSKSEHKPTITMSKDFPESSRKRKSRDLDDDDAITILNAVVEFRTNHGGSAPTPTTMKPVFDAVKGSLREDLTIDQLYNKFRTLKHRYYRAVQFGVGPTPFDRTFFDLSVRAWGEKKPKEIDHRFENSIKEEKRSKKPRIVEENGDHHHHQRHEPVENGDDEADAVADDDADDEEEEEEDNDDLGDSFKYVTDQATKYWAEEGLSLATLELGLKYMDRSKAAALEKRWRQHFEAELKIEAKSFDANRDLLAALVAGQKGGNS